MENIWGRNSWANRPNVPAKTEPLPLTLMMKPHITSSAVMVLASLTLSLPLSYRLGSNWRISVAARVSGWPAIRIETSSTDSGILLNHQAWGLMSRVGRMGILRDLAIVDRWYADVSDANRVGVPLFGSRALRCTPFSGHVIWDNYINHWKGKVRKWQSRNKQKSIP